MINEQTIAAPRVAENPSRHNLTGGIQRTSQWLENTRWPALLLLLIALAIVGAGCAVRGLNPFVLLSSFGVIAWFTMVPGCLLLLLFEREVNGRLRFFLMGTALGLTMMPVIYSLLLSFGLWHQYGVVQTAVNLVLMMGAYLRVRSDNRGFSYGSMRPSFPVWLGLLLLAAVIIVVLREFTQLLPTGLNIVTQQEIDSGFLMGIVTGIKQYGVCVNMQEGAGGFNYHYFAYLFMALVSTYSGADTLTIYQVVSPLFGFVLLALSVFYVTRQAGGGVRAALFSGLLILVLDDFGVLNTLLGVVTRSEPKTWIYSNLAVKWLHASPSFLYSVILAIIALGELKRMRERGFSRMIPLILVTSIIAGYKVSTWMCVMGGLGLVSLFFIRKRPTLLLATALAGIGGIATVAFAVGFGDASAAVSSVYIGYPILRSDLVVPQLSPSYMLTPEKLTPGVIALIAGLTIPWLLLTFGIRSIWMIRSVRNIKGLLATRDILSLTVFGTVVTSVVLVLAATPGNAQHMATYYWIVCGMLLATPFVGIILDEYLGKKSMVIKLLTLAIVFLQCGSSIAHIVKPIVQKKTITYLSSEWLAGMHYLRDNTEPQARLVSNRFDFYEKKSGPVNSDERFYYVPAFAERAVVCSGTKFQVVDRGKSECRVLVDSLLTTVSPADGKSIASSLDADYIVIDHWKGEQLACTDSSFVRPVFNNKQMTIYKVQ